MDLGPNGKANFTWSMIGTVFESALNFVLLIIVNRVIGENGGGVFTLAFSHAQLMYYIGTLEVRPIHSTDVKQKYRFADYFSLRSVTCALMLLASLAYVLLMDGDPFKKRVVMYMCVYKVIDAMLDVFASMFQQHDRIEYSGKVSTLRIALELTGFTAVLIITRNLEWASLTMIAIALIILLTYNMAKWRKFDDVPIHLQFSHAREILTACLPLFVSVFVMLYISNAPKYAIDAHLTEEVQAYYNVLFMPAFVIQLIAYFIFNPILTTYAKLWLSDQRSDFRKLCRLIRRQCLILLGLTALAVAVALTIGIPVLSWIFDMDLAGHRVDLAILMIGGGAMAYGVFFNYVITIIREQLFLLISYAVASAAALVLSGPFVVHAQITGASMLYAVLMCVLAALLAAVLLWKLRARSKKELLQ